MPKNMTVDKPQAGIIGIEFHRNAISTWHQHGVPEGAVEPAIIDGDHLKRVSVKMHRMRHGRFIDELQSHSLPGLDSHLGLLASGIIHVKRLTIDEPLVAAHIALQAQDSNLIGSFVL